MTTRRDTRSFSSGTTTSFTKVGPDGPPVASASAWPSPYTVMAPRDRGAVRATPPGRALRHRRPVEITGATTGPALGRFTEEATANTVRHLSIADAVGRAGAGPREQDLLDHVFGVNLRGR